MYQVYDQILSQEEINAVQGVVTESTGVDFPWYMSNHVGTVGAHYTLQEGDVNTREYPQFVHNFRTWRGLADSDHVATADFVLNKFLDATGFELRRCMRVKANMHTQLPGYLPSQYTTPHVDISNPGTIEQPYYVLIYYVFDSDGDTRIFSRQYPDPLKLPYEIVASVQPRAGRYLLFKGAQYHASAYPSINKYRIVINYNLEFANPPL